LEQKEGKWLLENAVGKKTALKVEDLSFNQVKLGRCWGWGRPQREGRRKEAGKTALENADVAITTENTKLYERPNIRNPVPYGEVLNRRGDLVGN